MENKKISLLHFNSLDSTNKYALQEDIFNHLTVVVADSQTGGRGRLGRSFYSPKEGLYMSVVLQAEKIKCPLSLCTPAAAVAVRETLEKYCSEEIKIKWVNDLLINEKKVCGILTQAHSEQGKINKIVVGIGINLKEPSESFPADIKEKVGTVGFSGDKLILAEEIALTLDKYVSSEGKTVLREYVDHLAFLGTEREITDYGDGNRKIKGTILGVNEKGYIIIKTDEGEERIISSGEFF